MSEVQKLTDDELASVKDLRAQIASSISTVGQLKVTHDLIQDDLEVLKTQLNEQISAYKGLMQQEKKLVAELLEKYGIGSLDIETGVFTPEK